MNGIQRTSLAEFSRLYLRSLDAAPVGPDGLSGPTASLQVSENSFAVQIVLGMSKNNRGCLSDNRAVRLIG
jgi:hypothetical protein